MSYPKQPRYFFYFGGVIVALAVNYYLPREKVVPLWEGFKVRISGKSAK